MFDPKLIAKYRRRFLDFGAKTMPMYRGHNGARDSRVSQGAVRHRCVARPDLDDHRRGAGDGDGMAGTVARRLLSARVFRRGPAENPDRASSATRRYNIVLGILPDGTKEMLGIQIEQTEGVKFWGRVMNELKNCGVADILIAVVDGLKGFSEAINAAFPETVVQTCIVYLLRNSMSFASWKDRKPNAQALRAVYRAEPLRPPSLRWKPSNRTIGESAIRRLPRAGVATGTR
jgi:putative transposase